MKTFITNGTGSQQSLQDIQDDKIPVYDTIADAQTDLANLEVGQIVATKDFGTESLVVSDAVTDGDMHPVTSNAVYYALIPEIVYSDINDKIFVHKLGELYIFTLQGCTKSKIADVISSLSITTQKPQIGSISRRDSGNSNVYPATFVFYANGTVNAWYANGGSEIELGATDIIFGQMIIYNYVGA